MQGDVGSTAESSNSSMAGTGGVKVRDVVRDVVTEIAPEELLLVEGLLQLDDDAVVRRLRQPVRDEPLGFGLGEVAALVAPVVWLVVDEAARRVAGSAVDGTAKGLRALVGKVRRKRTTQVVVPVLSRDQLVEVRQRVLETATQQDFDEERASAIADAVVARLALAAPNRQERGPVDDGPSPV